MTGQEQRGRCSCRGCCHKWRAARLTGLARAQSHSFCGRCGAPTAPIEAGAKRQCGADARHRVYPRTDPVVRWLTLPYPICRAYKTHDLPDPIVCLRGGWAGGMCTASAGPLLTPLLRCGWLGRADERRLRRGGKRSGSERRVRYESGCRACLLAHPSL